MTRARDASAGRHCAVVNQLGRSVYPELGDQPTVDEVEVDAGRSAELAPQRYEAGDHPAVEKPDAPGTRGPAEGCELVSRLERAIDRPDRTERPDEGWVKDRVDAPAGRRVSAEMSATRNPGCRRPEIQVGAGAASLRWATPASLNRCSSSRLPEAR